MFFGLSVRQFIFVIFACGAAVGIYFARSKIVSICFMEMETLSWFYMLGATPYATLGFIRHIRCIIYSLFAASPPSVAAGASAITQVWTYVGELLFNMLVLVGTIKLSDRVVKDMMGL